MQPGGKWTWPMLDSSLYHALVFNVIFIAAPKSLFMSQNNPNYLPKQSFISDQININYVISFGHSKNRVLTSTDQCDSGLSKCSKGALNYLKLKNAHECT